MSFLPYSDDQNPLTEKQEKQNKIEWNKGTV